jgi:hypothetical protein
VPIENLEVIDTDVLSAVEVSCHDEGGDHVSFWPFDPTAVVLIVLRLVLAERQSV